ncbi:DexA exonuclease A [Aeromonas phage phiAS5]|uniref:DexA exonuclease A n=1 Tax=Aeromonas phage phiAS5 TaxID=879630 RepID=E1A2N4_9CAUD|nr:DexA exonuclease A [Aeromonas phage phiAS5]ADM79980.1 DexA exonuclease A [Aeromonas phage phiAS5]BES53248.1 hypothetical protein [Aeromonas phage phiWae14]
MIQVPEYDDYIIDMETLSNKANATAIDLAVIVYREDVMNPPSFKDLVSRGIKIKFDLKSQSNRHKLKSTIDWWKNQSPEAKKNLKPSEHDVTIEDGIQQFFDFIRKPEFKVDYWKSLAWCRGNSFDFTIFEDMLSQFTGNDDTIFDQPVNFSRQRDIRTAIEQNLGTRMQTICPLPKGTLDGFVKHDSIHDAAKDILMLIYSKRYAWGLQEIPSSDDVDPLSILRG